MLEPVSSLRPLIVAGAALALAACQREEPPSPAPSPAVESPAPAEAAPPVLDRRGLLEAVSRAASDHAAGVRPIDQDPLVGRRFAVRLAFGCGAASSDPAATGRDGLAQWAPGGSDGELRISLTPEDWTESAPFVRPGEASWEAVEGFWIDRPWMEREGCPGIAIDPLAAPAPETASPQTVGLAAVFDAGGSRLSRRNGRAYAFTVRAPAGDRATPPDGGWRVLLEGRIASFPDGRAVRCRSASPDQRPVCVVAIKLDKVAFNAADGAMLSEWRTG